MDRYDISILHDANSEEPLYCSGPQNVEDIILEGSDTEQSAEEVRQKRYRYEESARRYLCGHLPVIQSANLRGPLDKESGWVNPWRYRPQREADWWQPGSEDMLFTRTNVMKRAADHGLGYMTPVDALAWCKATAEAEASARRHTEQGESMEAVKAEDSDGEYWNEGSDVENVPEVQPQEDSGHGDQISLNCPGGDPGRYSPMAGVQLNENRNTSNSTGQSINLAKRPADSGWLKGSYISKRARWDDPAPSSPTPLPDLQSERGRRRRQGSARSSSSNTRRPNFISQSTAPWSHYSQQKGTVSRYDRSTVQGAEVAESKRTIDHRRKDLDDLQEDSRETTFVSAPDFLPVSQGKAKSRQFLDDSFSDLEPDDFAIISTQDTSRHITALTSRSSVRERWGSASIKLPTIPHSLQMRADNESIEDDSFITEVAPSSRNLEKFQYRKKRGKSKQHQSGDNHQTSYTQNKNARRSSTRSNTPEPNVQSSRCKVSLKIGNSPRTSLAGMACVASEQHSVAPTSIKTPRLTALSGNEVKLAHEKISPGSRQSYNWVVVENNTDGPTPNRDESEHLTQTPAFRRSRVTNSPKRVAKASPPKINRKSLPVDAPQVDSLPNSSREALSMKSSQPDRSGSLEDVSRPELLPGPPRKSQTKPKAEEFIMDLRGALIMKDIGTQSFNSTASRSMRSPRLSPSDAGSKAVAVEEISYSEEVESLDVVQGKDGSQEPTQMGDCNSDDMKSSNWQRITPANIMNAAYATREETQDEMEIIQNALSQDCASFSSSYSTQSDMEYSSLPSVCGSHAELGRTIPFGPKSETQGFSDRAQDNWQGYDPQSPWMASNLSPGVPSNTNCDGKVRSSHTEQQITPDRASSPPSATSNENSGDQSPECPTTLESDGIKLSKDFMTPTLSPNKAEAHTERVSSTQQLIDAATSNPWASNFKSRVPGKSKKRVSFGVFSSEEREESPFLVSIIPEQVPGSPPPPRTVHRPLEEDIFDDGTTGVKKAAANLSAACVGVKLLPPRETGSLTSSSPAVAAMAEAFIAADREVSLDRERRAASDTSSTRHLKPKSDARTNISYPEHVGVGFSLMDSLPANPSEKTTAMRAIDRHMEDNLDEFLGDASLFLEDWSLEAEVKKANELRGKEDGRARNLLGTMSGWS